MDVTQCKEVLETYKNFLGRLDGVGEFLKLAEVVGMEEIPDLTRTPATLLDALEKHIAQLTGTQTPQVFPHFFRNKHCFRLFAASTRRL